MVSILALLTCFNRKEKTEQSIRSIVRDNPDCRISFVITDDNSTDGTIQMLEEMKAVFDIHILKGNGSLFYSGGMCLAMQYAKEKMKQSYDYMLMMNDDVEFFNHSIEKMIAQSIVQNNAIIAGAMKNDDGSLSYGAVKYIQGIKYRTLSINEWEVDADTFNANCVLIPWKVFQATEIIDNYYIHSLGDFDYGLSLKRNGYKIHTSKNFVGICNNNPAKGTWIDTSLSRKQRIKKKESLKGAPIKQWFYFLNKNFGIIVAIKSCVTPYIRILFRK